MELDLEGNDEIEIHRKEDDAYAEDDLPDLVLDTHRTCNSNSNSSLDENNQDYLDSTSSSVIDLLLSMTKDRRRSVSSSDIAQWVDAGDDEIDNFDGEEVI